MVQAQHPHTIVSSLPAVDRLVQVPALEPVRAQFGRRVVVDAARVVLGAMRARLRAGAAIAPDEISDAALARAVARCAAESVQPSLRPVFNLTGTVLHTNLGRAVLPDVAIEAVRTVLGGATNLEYDLAAGRRGDRDAHIDRLLCELTGAEAATVVNNNAAAVLLMLNTLALRKEVVVSRGELIEIGGAFRIPDVMSRAGCRLREVGTTNRTHHADYADAIGTRTAALMRVHTSNYAIVGFTANVAEADLAALAHAHDLPLIVDLGSGSLVDLAAYGLPHEPTPQATLKQGADLVSFSGDKLLGGPQAGLIVGRADLIARIKRNPLKRALRVDKATLAALEAVLRLYRDPDRLRRDLPTLRWLTRPLAEIDAAAARLAPILARAVGDRAQVTMVAAHSQIGSGALPIDLLPSRALVVRPARGGGSALRRLAAAFRALPVPVIGHIADGALQFDLRCLDDEAGFIAQLGAL